MSQADRFAAHAAKFKGPTLLTAKVAGAINAKVEFDDGSTLQVKISITGDLMFQPDNTNLRYIPEAMIQKALRIATMR